ncbi:MAG: zinc ribbon domain-containing protein, partial [Candidatus Micrarchaeia archaeon]
SAGMKVIKIDSRDTTQECSRCGHIKTGDERLGLSERIYHCNACGLTMDRDENAAKVILKRAKLLEKVSSKASFFF